MRAFGEGQVLLICSYSLFILLLTEFYLSGLVHVNMPFFHREHKKRVINVIFHNQIIEIAMNLFTIKTP